MRVTSESSDFLIVLRHTMFVQYGRALLAHPMFGALRTVRRDVRS